MQHLTTHCSTCKDLETIVIEQERTIRRLEAALTTAHHDPIWNIDTRQGLERRMPHLHDSYGAIVIDIDHMHRANDDYGQDEVDVRVTEAIRRARLRSDDTYAGRWKEGDEIVIFAHACDLAGLAERLSAAFRAEGLSITAALVGEASHAAIATGRAQIECLKRAGQRGRIVLGSDARC